LLFGLFQSKTFKYSYLNYFLPILCILIYYANLKFTYTYLTNFNTSISWYDIATIGLLIPSVIALVSSFLIWVTEQFLINENTDFSLKLILKTFLTFLALSLPLVAIFIFGEHINQGIDYFFPSFLIFVALALGRGLLLYLNHISDSLVKEKDVELSRLKEVNAQAETRLLQSQINPHFLYNSLNSIASLAPIDAQKTQKMAHSLSDLFKYSINRKDKKTSTVHDEVEMVKTYLDIEKIRFGDRLQFTVTVDQDLENHEIPLFLIQPLVENAVKHGISKNEGVGTIGLKISKEQNEIKISVSDNGPDFPEGLLSGHGLQTVFDLLRLTYGDKAALNWTNTPEKMIIITIPESI
jgi:two-component system LytT family sensor kinase